MKVAQFLAGTPSAGYEVGLVTVDTMAGDTQPGLTARWRVGDGRGTRLMRKVLIEVDHRPCTPKRG